MLSLMKVLFLACYTAVELSDCGTRAIEHVRPEEVTQIHEVNTTLFNAHPLKNNSLV